MLARRIAIQDDCVSVFDIRFLRRGYPAARDRLSGGGLMVVPSAPSLMPAEHDDDYYRALKGSDFAIPDSGLMVLAMRLLHRVRMERLSGLEFLRRYLADLAMQDEPGLYLVEPSAADHEANSACLAGLGVNYDPGACYLAPMYREPEVRDRRLLEDVEARRPAVVLINLGGGVQERVGYFLRQNLSYRPAIVCTGAAIAFLSGRQVRIPGWADYLYLGWLFRCCSNPRRFLPRYLYGLKLVSRLAGCALERGGRTPASP